MHSPFLTRPSPPRPTQSARVGTPCEARWYVTPMYDMVCPLLYGGDANRQGTFPFTSPPSSPLSLYLSPSSRSPLLTLLSAHCGLPAHLTWGRGPTVPGRFNMVQVHSIVHLGTIWPLDMRHARTDVTRKKYKTMPRSSDARYDEYPPAPKPLNSCVETIRYRRVLPFHRSVQPTEWVMAWLAAYLSAA